MKEALTAYVKRVAELAGHVEGNEQATKQSLIAPLFQLLGYDLTDPRECMPEYKADFGTGRSVKPVDWAFFLGGKAAFFVEAKAVGKKLALFDEQLGDYFAKAPEAKLGILANGVEWRFFTDVVNENVMDKEPFLKWSVLSEEPPYDFLTLLQKTQFTPHLVRAFAERKRNQGLLVSELARLLEPSADLIKLAIENLETRKLTAGVLEQWKPIVANAINEWARQRALSEVLSAPSTSSDSEPVEQERPRIETTQEELDAFARIAHLLGPARPIAYQDTVGYFKIHLPERSSWAFCRLYLGKRSARAVVAVEAEEARARLQGMDVTTSEAGWSSIPLGSAQDIDRLADVLVLAWDRQRAEHPA